MSYQTVRNDGIPRMISKSGEPYITVCKSDTPRMIRQTISSDANQKHSPSPSTTITIITDYIKEKKEMPISSDIILQEL